jgi:hypothetical protein
VAKFFKRRLRLGILFRMIGPRLQARQLQPPQQLADRPLMHLDIEALLDHRAETDTAPAHHAIRGQIGAGQHKRPQLCHLAVRQRWWPTTAAGVPQPCHALGIVAVHPVAQRLPFHPTSGRCFRAARTIEDQRDRQHAARDTAIAAARRLLVQHRRGQIVPGDPDRMRHPALLANRSHTRANRKLDRREIPKIQRVRDLDGWYNSRIGLTRI